MAGELRVSRQMLRVLRVLVEKPLEPRSGAELSKMASVPSGTLYPLVQRLEQSGWVTSAWEQVDPSEVGRPRRRFYSLTGSGRARAVAELTELQTSPGALVWE
jgi:PadR family transcriptional regulator, regulatory protein PadR